MFDSLIQEVAKKFGLGNKASWVLSALLGLMFNKSGGGLSGFLSKLTSDGLGEIVNSWVGKEDSMVVNSTQVKSAIGSDFINNLASKFDLPSGPIGLAIAHMLPKIVNALTPDGVIPDSIPAAIAHYIKDEEPVAATPVTRSYIAEEVDDEEGSGFNWWWLLLPLFLLLGYCTLKPSAPTVTEPVVEPVVVPEPVVSAPVIPSINSSLSISNDADIFNVSGTVADDATKSSIIGTLNTVLGSDKVRANIDINPAARNVGWLSNLSGILSALKGAPGARLDFDGDNISLGGNMEQGVIDGLMEKLRSFFGGSGFNISSQAIVAQALEAVQDLVTDGNEAIQNMVASGTVTGESLVSALNVAGINFATGSFNITPDSLAVLRTAAEAINIAPAGTLIEVGGHTDNTGSSQLNANLSQQRAQAVVDTLVGMGVDASTLSAKGYGDSQPIADNSTWEGRSENRRMEFSLQ